MLNKYDTNPTAVPLSDENSSREPDVQNAPVKNKVGARLAARFYSIATGTEEEVAKQTVLYQQTGSVSPQAEALKEQVITENAVQEEQDAATRIVSEAQARQEETGTPVTSEEVGSLVEKNAALANENIDIVAMNPMQKASNDALQRMPDGDYDNETIDLPYVPYSRYVVAEQIAHGAVIAQIKDIVTSTQEGGLEAGGKAEVGVAMATELLPLKDTTTWLALAQKYDLDSNVLVGNIKTELVEKFAAMSPEQKIEFVSDLATTMDESAAGWTDGTIGLIVGELTDPEVVRTGNVDRSFVTVIDNTFGIVDMTAVGALGIAMLRGFKAAWRATKAASLRQVTRFNKDRGVQETRQILKDQSGEKAGSFGIEREDAARTQVPTVKLDDDEVDLLDDVPDDVLVEEEVRLDFIDEEIDEIVETLDTVNYTPEATASVLTKVMNNLRDSYAGTIRAGRSTISLMEDGRGAVFSIMVGKNSKQGFGSTRTVLEQAQQLINEGKKNVRIYKSDGSTMSPSLETDDVLKQLDDIRDPKSATKSERGQYYISFDEDYMYKPDDMALFGDELVVEPEFKSLASFVPDVIRKGAEATGLAGYLLNPSSRLTKKLYQPLLNKTLQEQALTEALEAIVAPVFRMSAKSRIKINDMHEWGRKFAMENGGKAPTRTDFKVKFGDNISQEEFKGLTLVNRYYDRIYDINNTRLYRDWNTKGIKTLTNKTTGAQLHGKPTSLDEIAGEIGDEGQMVVYDPVKDEFVTLTKNDIDEVYDGGGNFYKLESDLQDGNGDVFTSYVLNKSDNADTIEAGPLSSNPLKYDPYYKPTMYEDNYVIQRVVENAVVNGSRKTKSTAIAVVQTRKEAEALTAQMNGKSGTDSVSYTLTNDRRFSDGDRVAKDLDVLQTEGRLFFGNRREVHLPDATLKRKADLVSPIDAIQRSARMVSRQVSTESSLATARASFYVRFGNLILDDGTDTGLALSKAIDSGMTEGKISELIRKTGALMSKADSASRAEAKKASQLWDYMRVMRANGETSTQFTRAFKAASIRSQEFLATTLLPKGSGLQKSIIRTAGEGTVTGSLRSLAFLDFIITRPARQLVLQSSQSLMLAPLDLAYSASGKWFKDSTLLLQGMKSKGKYLAGGKKVSKALKERNAKEMDISVEEYERLVDKFGRSGNVQSVSIHAYAGDLNAPDRMPKTAGQRAAQAAANAVKLPFQKMKQYGFDLGEQYNLTASYTMALRRHMKETKKTIMELSDDEWVDISTRANGYALSMNKANASKYQYGLLSLPLQFISHSHKMLLTMLGTNKAFTRKEYAQIVAGQAIMFGGGAVGLRPEVEMLLEKYGLAEAHPELADILAGGTIDYLMDKSLSAITGKEQDLAITDFLAPAGGGISLIRAYIDVGMNSNIAEIVLGASFDTAKGYVDAAKESARLIESKGLTPETALNVLDEVGKGAFSGYSDFSKTSIAWHSGRLQGSDGKYSSLQKTRLELMAQGLLGIRTEEEVANWALSNELYDKTEAVRQDAKAYASEIRKQLRLSTDGSITKESYRKAIELQQAYIELAYKDERPAVIEEFLRLIEQDPLGKDIIEGLYLYVTDGNAPSDMMMAFAKKLSTPEEFERFQKLVNEQVFTNPR